MSLTSGEINESFKIAFVDKEKLLQMLSENQIVVDNIIKGILYDYSKQKKK